MCKNRLALHSVAVLSVLFFAFMAISSGASTPKAVATDAEETIVTSKTTSEGRVYNIPSPDKRPFDTLGLVFATSITKFDEKGQEVANQEGITTMLLREAQKLGGNDILNFRKDENVTYVQTKVKEGATEKTVITKNVIITGSALAIKYRNDDEALRALRNYDVETLKALNPPANSR
ncbi:MAG: hypothetical protein LBI04_07790 [Treponema sp.]|jgi:hypothetical protein|nr:hypothetical protein [Treponema sp.]